MGTSSETITTNDGSLAGHSPRTAAPASSSIDDLTDDLLELVLARLRSPVCLRRAMATFKLWRRVIAGAGFVRRRFRSLHAPCVLGHYCAGGRTIFIPSPAPAPGAGAAMDICDDVLRDFLLGKL